MKTIQLLFAVSFLGFTAKAQNPIVQTIYTADPAPMVHNDTVWLYTGHDEDKSTWFTMKEWRCYSSTDMVNWRDHGAPLSLKTFSWAEKDAWAGQCIYRNGKFYFYVPVHAKGLGMSIGVAVSDRPDGPFVDALGKPLVHSGSGDIDPTVFIDDDGQAYLYWGNPYLKYVKLNEDMISYSGEVVTVPLTKEGFNVRYKDVDKRPSAYEEGPWFYKRNGLYYLLYPAGGVPEHIAYSTSKGPTGPWKYRDTIMRVIQKGGAFTNHPGVIDYKGRSYFFYHNGALPGGGGFTRSVCVEEFQYNADGSIPRIEPTVAGVAPVSNLNPYKWVEAETIAWEVGVETAWDNSTGMYVIDIDNGDYIKVRSVDFKKGAKSFAAEIASLSGGAIEIRLNSPDGILIGTCDINNTGGLQSWKKQSCKVKKVKGIHDVYFVFKGGEGHLFNFNRWKFNN
ncbi:MAG: family 43 glycosylhydrolase [Flavisolibacter sp.]|nr:family 43 glycosylhydrolase [Flavisolibacter sp.]